jgi:hypothetical protein
LEFTSGEWWMVVEEEEVLYLLRGLEMHDSIVRATCTIHANLDSCSHHSIGKALQIKM